MVRAPLLSTYRTGENRVTASTIAVFERIDLALVQELLGAATGSGDELRTVTFENQSVHAGSTPDARISGRFTWWFETKTARGAYASEGHARHQLRQHSRLLGGDPEALLFVVTPDPFRPSWFEVLDGVDAAVRERVLWFSFSDLAELVKEAISDPKRVLGEQTRFLLAELVALYESDGLLTADDTVVVAARAAWPEYKELAAYVCQPERSFREGLTHFGFYADGAVQPLVPRIRRHFPAVLFTLEEASAREAAGEVELAGLIEHTLGAGTRVEGESYGVLLLSARDDPDTVRLEGTIVNDTRTTSGRNWAWTLSQRYTSLDALRRARSTSQL